MIAFGCWLFFSIRTFLGGAAELDEGFLPAILF
jgi:hypothetical protein